MASISDLISQAVKSAAGCVQIPSDIQNQVLNGLSSSVLGSLTQTATQPGGVDLIKNLLTGKTQAAASPVTALAGNLFNNNVLKKLGIGAALLYSGTMTTGSASFTMGSYNFYVIIGQPSSSGSRTPIVVPRAALTTGAVAYQITDESYYYSFNLYYSGSTVYMAYKARNSSGQIIAVYGVI